MPKANSKIESQQVRLIDSEGNMVGVVGLDEALRAAKAKSLDLVEISPNSSPPVCKILDFGKYKFEAKKKAHSNKKKQKTVDTKEIKVRPNIGAHDLEIKINSAIKFINDGNKVKVSLRFRGREITHQELGMQLFVEIKEKLSDISKVEVDARLEGRQILMILAPR